MGVLISQIMLIDVVYACGPMPMLAAVARLAGAAGVPSWIAVEEAMACGIGVCMTCVLPVKPRGAQAAGDIRMIRACTDGPVFPGDAVQFDLIGRPLPAVNGAPAAAAPVPDTFEAPI